LNNICQANLTLETSRLLLKIHSGKWRCQSYWSTYVLSQTEGLAIVLFSA